MPTIYTMHTFCVQYAIISYRVHGKTKVLSLCSAIDGCQCQGIMVYWYCLYIYVLKFGVQCGAGKWNRPRRRTALSCSNFSHVNMCRTKWQKIKAISDVVMEQNTRRIANSGNLISQVIVCTQYPPGALGTVQSASIART